MIDVSFRVSRNYLVSYSGRSKPLSARGLSEAILGHWRNLRYGGEVPIREFEHSRKIWHQALMKKPNLQPTLTGSLVTLKPMQEQDWTGMFKAASNPKTWAGHVKRDRYKEDVFRPYFNSGLSSGSAFSIFDNKSEKIIGTSRYHEYKSDIAEIEIGWTFIDCDYWGGKYNAEVKRLMLQHAFNFLDVVVFWVAEENFRSRGAMSKIGGTLRQGEFSKTDNGELFPYVVYEIRQKGFLTGPLNS